MTVEASGKSWLLDLPLDRVHHPSFPMEVVHGVSMIRGAGRIGCLRALLDPKSWEHDYYLRTAPRRRKLLRSLMIWADEQPVRPPNLEGLSPGMGLPALARWAEVGEVSDWLGVPMREVLPALYSRDTVAGAITGAREEAAWAAIDWLAARVGDLADGREEALTLPTSPSDARVAGLFARALQARQQWPNTTKSLPRRAAATPQLRSDRDEISVIVSAALPAHEAPRSVTIPLDDLAPRCACGERCAHGLLALNAILYWLADPIPSDLAAALSTPAWRRRLSALVPAPSTEVVWRLTDDYLAESGLSKRGGWTATPVAQHPDRQDRAITSLLADSPTSGAILRALVDHPRVVDAAGRAITVRRPVLGTQVVRDPGLRVLATVNGLDAASSLWTTLPGEVRITTTDGVLWLVDTTDPWWRAAALLEGGLSVPDGAEGELLDLLPSLQQMGSVAFDPTLRGEAMPANSRPLLRLTSNGDTIRAEAMVLPLPLGEPQPLGRGADVVYAVGPNGTIHAVRNFEAEQVAWRGAALDLEGEGPWLLNDPETAHALLTRIQSLGETIQVQWLGRSKTAVSPTPTDVTLGMFHARDYLVLSGQLAIDDTNVPLDVLFAALRGGKRFLSFNDRLVRLASPILAEMTRLARLVDGDRLPVALVGEIVALQQQGVAVAGWDGTLAAATEIAPQDTSIPAGLVADLRPYQRDGVVFLRGLGWAGGALLCDDMGLGKTVQALGLLVDRAQLGPALVVAPTSLGFNWVRETERFAPGLVVRLHHGAGRHGTLTLGPGDVLVTTWDLLVRDADRFAGVRFATAVFDEAQAAKNPDTRRSRSAREIDAAFRLVLSGTPLENRLSELWSLVSLALPGILGDRETFRERFALPIERDGDDEVRGQLARILSRFMLRRRKEDVARDLPPRTDVVVPVDLSAAEHRLYEHARQAALYLIAGVDMSAPQARFQVLAALTTLRQLACHPQLRHPEGPASSSKIEHLRELCAALKAQGHRVLVFSQFVRLLQLARPVLAEEGLKLRYLDGSTSLAARRAEVDAFQAGDGDVFLISLKAGGTGLNLTAASYVVHLDPWWNPAVEAQASDRAHRIGQERPVTVYKLVARGTIEERIVALQDRKRELIRGILDADAGPLPSLDELRDLLG